MKQIPLAHCSAWIAAAVWIIGPVGAVVILTNQLYFFKHETGLQLLTLWFLGEMGLSLLGVVTAVGGLVQSGRKRAPAVLGLVLNSLVLLAGLGLFAASR